MNQAGWKLLGATAIAFAVGAPHVAAQDNYPSAPIRFIVGFAAGGTTDVFARLMAQKLSAQMNTSGVVENRLGANGNIAAETVARARPDGYTLLVNTSGVVLSPALEEKLNYDLFKDLVPVALVAAGPQWLVVRPSVPANTVTEFIAYLKSNPGKLAYGSAGNGNITHLAAVMFLQASNLSALHVPYKSASIALTDVVSGGVQFSFSDLTSILPLVKDNRVRVLATGGLKRSPILPNVPTLSETVMPGFEIGSWTGVMVPAKTPAAIVKRLNEEIVKAMQDTGIISRSTELGQQVLSSTPEEFSAYLKSELERWTKVVKSAGIKIE